MPSKEKTLLDYLPLAEEEDGILILLNRQTGVLQLVYEGIAREPIEIEAIIETAKDAYLGKYNDKSPEAEKKGFLN
jgi:hypothetical protein